MTRDSRQGLDRVETTEHRELKLVSTSQHKQRGSYRTIAFRGPNWYYAACSHAELVNVHVRHVFTPWGAKTLLSLSTYRIKSTFNYYFFFINL